MIFEDLINELKLLETNGFEIEKNNETLRLKGTISYIVADNLAANNLAGLVESFGCKVNGFCRFCYGQPDEIQTYFCDTCFVNRTNEEYRSDVATAFLTEKPCRGVKTDSPFNSLQYFKIIESQPPDIMHDFLEGVFVYNFKCMMLKLKEEKILFMDEINEKLIAFQYGRNDKKNQIPSNVFRNSSIEVNGNAHVAIYTSISYNIWKKITK